MYYTEVTFHVAPHDEEVAEILVAYLGEQGFESFVYTDDGIKAYILSAQFHPGTMEQVAALPLFRAGYTVTWEIEEIENRDWNKLWEESFTPVVVANRVRVRAGFHDALPGFEHDIVIDPRMSFGTGHHATTVLMIEAILALQPLDGKEVLDMGCGTGILSILAAKVGAGRVTGIDIDEWAYRNALDNLAANPVRDVTIRLGDVRLLDGSERYDLILANINRNILLEDMPRYAGVLRAGGTLVTSGYYLVDLPRIREKALSLGLVYHAHRGRDEWCAAIFNSPIAIC
ncbi:MAG: 50S ribosomal protein L11 methyltransferase [Odoribacteraceae bacterium]|jgi:ribosomal protein L11 methyltransferase|nr:50S ribosomal protein L11 methyltransferase [Odoribacteraceae bacterium]